ncbi:hypothetical protein OG552_00535 [Streptomyces sp. NBC_01476]|uniref:hypothetical protein n=1 Tax=Streptomyces sp. NBC_01476 TaxID=2903881 RepID=UPI002E2EB829|nr:hypothetical protein [Streptomyces sp. NBC_01476]
MTMTAQGGAHVESSDSFPGGDSRLFVRFGGDDQEDVERQAHDLLRGPGRSPDDEDIKRLSGQFLTFSELLLRHAPEGRQPPAPTRAATVQTHCHQHVVTAFDAGRPPGEGRSPARTSRQGAARLATGVAAVTAAGAVAAAVTALVRRLRR